MGNYYKEDIKFSVLIPVYNVEEYIRECLDSVLNQTYSNYEIIITNDGSTDKSGQICEEYAQISDKIQVHTQKNQGLLMARRSSIAHCSGDYCLFLDSDDTWKSNTLEVIFKTIKSTEADMIIFNWDRLLDKETISSEPLFENREEFFGDNKNEIIESFIITNLLNSLCLKAVKSDIIDIDNDYSSVSGLVMGEDAIQSIPLFLNAEKIVYIPYPLYNYRMNDNSATNDFNPRHIWDLNIANEHKLNLAKQLNRSDLVRVSSERHLNVVSKQIMLASSSSMSKSDKIVYLEEIKSSHMYKETRKYIPISDLLWPIKLIVNELDNRRYENVLRLGKIYNVVWNNMNGLRKYTIRKVRLR